MLKRLSLFLLLASLNVYSQDKGSPFVFLNQFFKYDISQKYIVAGIEVPQNNFISLTNEGIQIDSQNSFFKGFASVVLRDQSGRDAFLIKKHDFDQSKTIKWPLKLKSEVKTSLRQICFSKTNSFSKITLCKPLSAESNQSDQSLPEVFIDSKKVESFGRVVLNDLTKNIQFTLKISRLDYFILETRQRSIMPVTIQKESNERVYKVTFADLLQKTCTWNVELERSQDNFEILCDSLLTTYQDFENKDKSNVEYNLTYYKPPPTQPLDDFYAVTPFFGSSKIEGNTALKKVSLVAQNDLGLEFFAIKKITQFKALKPISDVFPSSSVNLNLRSLQYLESVNSVSISNAKLLNYGIKAFLHRPLNEDLTVSVGITLANDTTLDYVSTSTQVTFADVLNKSLGAQLRYLLFDRDSSKIYVQSGYDLLLPTSMSGSDSSMGSMISAGAGWRYARGVNAYSLGIDYSLRDQETTLQKIRNQTFDYRATYSVSF